MTWQWVVCCIVLATAAGGTLPALLAHLPEPPDSVDKTPYKDLATPINRWIVIAATFGALAVSGITLTWPLPVATIPLGTVGVVLAVIDARTTYLPRTLVWAAVALLGGCLTTVALMTGEHQVLLWAAVGAGVMGGLFWVLWRFTGGMGFGDVRLALLVGGTMGPFGISAVITAAFIGSVVGLVWGLMQRWFDRRAGRPPGPFAYGPSLVMGPYGWMMWLSLVGGTPVVVV